MAEWREVTSTPIDATLASSLQSLAECQLQSQTSRAGALDAGAVGLMGVEGAIAASIAGARSLTAPEIVAFALLCAAFAIVATALLMRDGDDIGPAVTEVMACRGGRSDHDLVCDLLDDLALRVLANRHALDRKEPRLANALVLTLIAVLVELVGQIY